MRRLLRQGAVQISAPDLQERGARADLQHRLPGLGRGSGSGQKTQTVDIGVRMGVGPCTQPWSCGPVHVNPSLVDPCTQFLALGSNSEQEATCTRTPG